MPRFNQYIKKVSYNGITFDSKEELDYYLLLLDRQAKGEINYIEIHKAYELIPSYKVKGKTIKPLTYEADFVFYDNVLDIVRVVDVKGFADDVFKLKKKLFDYKFEYVNGLEVMKYAKSTGWVNYDEYKKARASYKKRLIEEKNSYKTQLEQIEKQKIKDNKLHQRYITLLDKSNTTKLTTSESNRLKYLQDYFKDKII
jgi:hypothetical protein